MSRRRREMEEQPSDSLLGEEGGPPLAEKPALASAEAEAAIESYRRCPRCWGVHRGYGIAQRTWGRTRYYKCVAALGEAWDGCGHNWKIRLPLAD